MSRPSFVYTMCINASPEAVWQAIVDPTFTRQYWMHDNLSDWEVGSRWEHVQVAPPEGVEAPWTPTPGKVDITGEVVESDHPRRLVLTWVSPKHEGDPARTSRVAFDLEVLEDWPGGPWTKLTLSHTEMDDEMAASVSYGWPLVLSVMKTIVERASVVV